MSAADLLLEARAVVVEHRGRAGPAARAATVRALDGLTLGVRRGEVLAVVGESGAGKSTVIRALLGLQPLASGEVAWRVRHGDPAVEPARASRRVLSRIRPRLQVVFQDPLASLDPRWTARATLGEALRVGAASGPPVSADAGLALLERVGLRAEHLDRLPHQLSGGERQRLCLARALATGPTFLALDEPVAALDASVQAQVLQLVADLRRERGLTCLLVTHDLSVAAWIADRIAVLDRGRIVEEGTPKEVLGAPRHARTRALVEARAAIEGP